MLYCTELNNDFFRHIMNVARLIELNPRILCVCNEYYSAVDIGKYTYLPNICEPTKSSVIWYYDRYDHTCERVCMCCKQITFTVGFCKYSCNCTQNLETSKRCIKFHYYSYDDPICLKCSLILLTYRNITHCNTSYNNLIRGIPNLQYEIAMRYEENYHRIADLLITTNILDDNNHIRALMCVRDYVMSSSIPGGNYDVYQLIVLKYLGL